MRPDEFEEPGAPQHRRREAPGGAHRLDDRRRRATSSPSSRSGTRRSSSPVVNFPADKFREGLVATDAEVAKHFEDHKETYRIGEKRKVRYVTIDQEGAAAERATVTGQQIERSYNDNIQQYSTPEQARASHILLKTEGKDDAAVKKQAEDLLAQIKKGANFEELAKKHSQDEVSAAKGGDLDFFNKGADGPRVRQGRVRAAARPDERPGEDRASATTSSRSPISGRPSQQDARRGAGADRGSVEVGAGAERRRRSSPTRSRRS